MATLAHNKYTLKTLHEEIDLFDRKLAHMLKYESFATDAARKSSASKMQAKRDLLARTARQMAEEGIEFSPSDLPRSFREGEEPHTAAAEPAARPTDTAAPAEHQVSADAPGSTSARFQSPFAGTVLDGQAHVVEAYKRSRAKLSS
jgi:hypothetical protein